MIEVLDDPETLAFPDEVTHCWRIERSERQRAFTPIQRLRTSEWADRHLMLSPEDTGELVKYNSALTPYHRAIMDSLGDIRVRRVVGMLASQLGKTTIMKADLGARIDQRPSPILWAVPRDKDVSIWSKERVDTLLRDTPVLRGKVVDATRDKRTTIARKLFPGGYVALVGMGQPADVAARPVPVVRVDEYDRAPRQAGTKERGEGSPLGLLRRRMSKFAYRSLGIFSTPTTTDHSPIVDEYETTDQRELYVPCPHCATFQVLKWGGPDEKFGIKWNDGNPDTAYYLCEECGCCIDERHKRQMLARHEWRPTHPDRPDHGYRANALISPFDGARWPHLIEEWYKTKTSSMELKQFVNTILCETYDDRTTHIEVGTLAQRLEVYEAEVPRGVAVLTRSVDTQDDRLEMAVWGFGPERETWPIDYEYIPGDPATPVPWRRLAELLGKTYRHHSGRELRPIATLIDAMGHKTTHVHAFAKRYVRDQCPVYPISGADELQGHPFLSKPTFDKHNRITKYRVGTWALKHDILTRLVGIEKPDDWAPGTPIPGYFHLPNADWFSGEQLSQLQSEHLVEKVVRNRLVRLWEVRGPNHYLDLAVYGLAALYLLGLKTVTEGLEPMAKALCEPYDGEESAPRPRLRHGRRMVRRGDPLA